MPRELSDDERREAFRMTLRAIPSRRRSCSICGRFTDRNGRCRKVFTVEPGVYEHE